MSTKEDDPLVLLAECQRFLTELTERLWITDHPGVMAEAVDLEQRIHWFLEKQKG